MIKYIRTAGTVLLTIGVLLTSVAAILAAVGHELDKESKSFVDAAVPAIVSEWDVAELQRRASPEFNATVDYADLAGNFALLRKLGTMREYKGSTGEARITISISDGVAITAVYAAFADFDEGTADMQLALTKQQGRWQIQGFRINPRDLADDTNTI
jgi:hypothetical protein